MARCIKHNFDDAIGSCRTCGNEFCRQCLVFPHGSKKPPLCVECALAKAGVRTQSVQRSVIQQRSNEARERAAAATVREREMANQHASRRPRAASDIDLAKTEEPSHQHHAMAGRVRLLLLLCVVAMVALGALLQVGL